MAGAGRGGLAVVVGWGRGDRPALLNRLDQSLAELRILSALQVRNCILGAAQAKFHVVGILAQQLHGSLQTAEGVKVVAEDDVIGRLLLVVVVEVAPGGDEFAPVGLCDARVDLRPFDARRRIGAPQWHSLAAVSPTSGPTVLPYVVVKGGEVGIACG